MKILIVDTYYPEVIRSLPIGNGSYRDELLKVLNLQFGTSNFYSMHLRQLGWDAIDVIANYGHLQDVWDIENNSGANHNVHIARAQIEAFKPDVVFMQDLSWYGAGILRDIASKYVLAGQLSCPWPRDEQVSPFHILFSSFPHYIPRIQKLGVKAHYLPLAFEPSVLTGTYPREIDCVFVGGVGTPSHWSAGMKVLEAIAEHIPTSCFYGYGYDLLPASSPIRKKWKGQAFGRDMYAILQRSKVCVNRHGEVAGEFANNMRLFEATGAGCLLVTERKTNMRDFFSSDEVVEYDNPTDAVAKIDYYLKHWDVGEKIAAAGQRRTLRDHTYAKRMQVVSDILKAELN